MTPTYLHQHSVKFYADDSSLFTTVSGFLAEGLASGTPAILIATEAHKAGIIEHLSARMIDCERAIRDGALVIANAEATLSKFMVRGRPSQALFEKHVGNLVGATAAKHSGAVIRAYGEMVDVLWKTGEREAAIRLEVLWNELATRHHFVLLCGYAMGNFYKQNHLMDEVSAQHSHVIEGDKVIRFPQA